MIRSLWVLGCLLLPGGISGCLAQKPKPADFDRGVNVLITKMAQAIFLEWGKDSSATMARTVGHALDTCRTNCDPFKVIGTIDKSGRQLGSVTTQLKDLKNAVSKPAFNRLDSTRLRAKWASALTKIAATQSIKPKSLYPNALPKTRQDSLLTLALGQVFTTAAPKPENLAQPAEVVSDTMVNEGNPGNTDEFDMANLLPSLMGFLAGLLLGIIGFYLLIHRKVQADNSRLRKERDDLKARLPTFPANNQPIDPRSRSNTPNLEETKPSPPASPDLTQPVKEEAPPTPEKPTPVPTDIPELVLTPDSQPPVPVVVPVAPVVEPPTGPPTVFYLPPPSEDGIFDGSQAAPMPSSTTAYRFSVNAKKSNEARFRFEAEPNRVERLMTYRHFYIKPACDSTDELLPGQTRIETVTEGVAILENDQWRVTKKALIRYQ